jgi:hypothetical protein
MRRCSALRRTWRLRQLCSSEKGTARPLPESLLALRIYLHSIHPLILTVTFPSASIWMLVVK